MSFDVDIAVTRGIARIATRFTSGAGLTALFGPSGAGKTTVLHAIAGLLRPDAGQVTVDGAVLYDSRAGIDLPPEHRHAGYVFQDARLFPHRRVRDNLLFGWSLTAAPDRTTDVAAVVRFLGLDNLLDRWPRTLSGGEARRVAIGRALLSGPRFLLLDEPLISLDQARREEIMTVVERIRDELKMPILYVTHDRAEVERLAGQIILL